MEGISSRLDAFLLGLLRSACTERNQRVCPEHSDKHVQRPVEALNTYSVEGLTLFVEGLYFFLNSKCCIADAPSPTTTGEETDKYPCASTVMT